MEKKNWKLDEKKKKLVWWCHNVAKCNDNDDDDDDEEEEEDDDDDACVWRNYECKYFFNLGLKFMTLILFMTDIIHEWVER